MRSARDALRRKLLVPGLLICDGGPADPDVVADLGDGPAQPVYDSDDVLILLRK